MPNLHGVEAGGHVIVQLGDDDVGGLLLPCLRTKISPFLKQILGMATSGYSR